MLTILCYLHAYATRMFMLLFIASTNRRHILVWKYNSSGCITALRTQTAVESLAYSKLHSVDF